MCYGGKGSAVTGNVQRWKKKRKKKLKLHVVSPFLVHLKRGGGTKKCKVGISPLVSY